MVNATTALLCDVSSRLMAITFAFTVPSAARLGQVPFRCLLLGLVVY